MNNLNLRIFELNTDLISKTNNEIMATDYTILNGIVCGEPHYNKGVKIVSPYYIDEKQTLLAVEKRFEDIIENGFLVGLRMEIIWYNIFNNPTLSKKVYIPLSTSEASNILTGRRKRQINYLQEAGVRMGVKQYIDMLFDYYSAYVVNGRTLNLLNNYIENGSNDFVNAINNETNEVISQILNANLPTGITTKQAILNEIQS